MPEIKNNAEQANNISESIKKAAEGFQLNGNYNSACVNVGADEDCNGSYRQGGEFSVHLREHVGRAAGYIKQISDTLQSADEQAAKNNRGVEIFKLKMN